MTINPLLAAAILFGAATLAHAQTAPAVVGNNATNATAVTSVPYVAHTTAKASTKTKAKVKAKAYKVKQKSKSQSSAKPQVTKAKKSPAVVKAKPRGPGLEAY